MRRREAKPPPSPLPLSREAQAVARLRDLAVAVEVVEGASSDELRRALALLGAERARARAWLDVDGKPEGE